MKAEDIFALIGAFSVCLWVKGVELRFKGCEKGSILGETAFSVLSLPNSPIALG